MGQEKSPKAKAQEERRNGARREKQERQGQMAGGGGDGVRKQGEQATEEHGQSCPRGEEGGGAECRPSRERDREKES